jgi:hypothetical protein
MAGFSTLTMPSWEVLCVFFQFLLPNLPNPRELSSLGELQRCPRGCQGEHLRDGAFRATQLLEQSERHTVSAVRCTTCHHTGMMFGAARTAIEHGIPIDRALTLQNLQFKLGADSHKGWLSAASTASQGVPVLQPAATIGMSWQAPTI